MSSNPFKLLDEIPGEDNWEDRLCDCGEEIRASLEIDEGALSISCLTCGKNLLPHDDYELICMGPTEVDVEFVQEHRHNWDTLGCDCNYYWELKTKVPHG